MGVRDWFRREERAITVQDFPYTASGILDASIGLNEVSVSIDKALGVPAVWAAVNFISDSLATVPFQLFSVDGDGNHQQMSDDPLYRLLHDSPNSEWTSYDFRKYMFFQMLTGGRAAAYIEKARNNQILGLWPIDPTRLRVLKNGVRRSYEVREDDGKLQRYDASEIVDLTYALKTDQLTEISPLMNNRDAVALNIALQNYAGKLFLNGGVPPLALEGPFNSPQAVARASDDVTAAIKNAAKDGKQVLPLPLNHKLNAIGINPEQGQFIDGRLFALQEVGRIYGLPPVFLQDLSKGTYANTEQSDLQVVKHTLSHWVQKAEQQFNLKLFRSNRNRFVKFNLDGLLRGDFKTRMEGYSKAIQNSIRTPNEVRAKDDLPPMEGGDDLVIQQNMTGVKNLGEANANRT